MTQVPLCGYLHPHGGVLIYPSSYTVSISHIFTGALAAFLASQNFTYSSPRAFLEFVTVILGLRIMLLCSH
jgi:hypothetical protein